MKSIIKVSLIIMTIVMVVYAISNLISCQDSSKVEKDKRKTEDQIKIKKAVSDMVVKYGAVDDWNSVLEKKDVLERIYTIHIQEALLNTNEKPILFYAILGDIIRSENDYIIRFETWFNYPETIRFELLGNEAQVKRLLKFTGDLLDEFAVVALIEEVRKPEFTIKAYPINSEEAEVEVESSDIFIANGKCLDFLYVGDFLPDK